MALSQILKQKCPVCDKTAIEKSRLEFGGVKLIYLECGHTTSAAVIKEADYSSITSSDGRQPMPFQVRGIQFAEEANARCLIADEQGLGKTVTVVCLLKLHEQELTPALCVTKTTIKNQWLWELIRWTGNKRVQVLYTGKEIAIPGMDYYICTYDALKNEHMFDYVDIKTIVLDEVQAIKNHLSGRAKAVQSIVKTKVIEHIIALSGTPIKNNTGEYFTILNLLMPSRFPEYYGYLRNYCDSYESAYGFKVGGLSNIDYFQEQTKDFIIRRVQSDVLPDLFKLAEQRKFQHVDLMSGKYAQAYRAALRELMEAVMEDAESAVMIKLMTKMRQITGVGKVDDCVDYITDFILSTSRRIVVFAHHHLTVDLLEQKINIWLKDGGYNPAVMYRAGDNREDALAKFSQDESRVMIASMLASGEGFDGLQKYCSDMILLERQWNPANEEQVEKRIHRIGQDKPCNFTYMIASETIDEYFTQLVEEKRGYMASALDGKVLEWNESNLMRELAEVLVSKGAKPWSL